MRRWGLLSLIGLAALVAVIYLLATRPLAVSLWRQLATVTLSGTTYTDDFGDETGIASKTDVEVSDGKAIGPIPGESDAQAIDSGDDGLLSLFTFDSGLSADVGVAGTPSNVTTSASGKFGGAASFNGTTGSYISLGDVNEVDEASALSFAAWIKPNVTTNSAQRSIVDKTDGAGTPPSFHLRWTAGEAQAFGPTFVSSGNVTKSARQNHLIPDQNWHHVAATFDGQNIKLYVDGTLEASGSYDEATTTVASTKPLKVGFNWSGLLDDVGIWTRALSADEVLVFSGTVPSSPDPGTFTSNSIDLGARISDITATWTGTSTEQIGIEIKGTGSTWCELTNGEVFSAVSSCGLATATSLTYRATMPANTELDEIEFSWTQDLTQPPSANLLTNSNFEQNTTGWTLTNATAPIDAGAHGGSRLLSIAASGSAEQTVSLSAASKYVFRGYYKAAGASGAVANLVWLNSSDEVLRTDELFTTSGTVAWTYYESPAQVTPPVGTSKVKVQFTNTSGTFYIDDAALATGFILTTSAINGSVSKSPNKTTYDDNASVTLTANANSGYVFTSWSGDVSSSTNPITISMTGSKAITANFSLADQGAEKSLYVDNNGGDGLSSGCSDTYTREQNTLSTPFCSVQRAANVVAPGDTVYIRGGTYTHPGGLRNAYSGVFSVTRAGTASKPITFTKYENEVVNVRDTSLSYAIWLGSIYPAVIPAEHIIIDGLVVRNGYSSGIYIQEPNGVIIRNNTIYDNGGVGNGAGITVAGGDDLLVENNRLYANGTGILLREYPSTDGGGSLNAAQGAQEDVIIKDNFVYASGINASNPGNSSGISIRYGDGATIEGNIIWDNADAGINGLGNVGIKILRNATFNAWQPGGNNAGIKYTVRGGGLNLGAFNIVSYNAGYAYEGDWGLGDLVMNNTIVHNDYLGMPVGYDMAVFNNIFSNNYPTNTGGQRETGISGSSDQIMTTSDYNLIGFESQGHLNYILNAALNLKNHLLTGSPSLVGPMFSFSRASVTQIIHPEQMFDDANDDGVVTVAEARADIAARYAPSNSSQVLGAGTTLETIEALLEDAQEELEEGADRRIADHSRFSDVKNVHANILAGRIKSYLINNSHRMIGELDSLKDFAGNSVATNVRLDLGAIQGGGGEVAAPYFTLTTSVSGGSETGSITRSPNQTSYESGTTVTLTATPSGSREFAGWGGALSGTTTPTTIVMDGNKTVTASFTGVTPTSYRIESTRTGTGGEIDPWGDVFVVPGSDQTFTFTPESGYYLYALTVDGEPVATSTLTGDPLSYTFSNINAGHTIDAVFVAFGVTPRYPLRVSGTNGSVSRTPSQNFYDYGTVVELTATPERGYDFVGWEGDASGRQNPLNLTVVSDMTVRAVFSRAGGGGGGGRTVKSTAKPGEEATTASVSGTTGTTGDSSSGRSFSPLRTPFGVGQRGNHIVQLKQMLVRDGVYTGEITDSYDAATVEAVKRFQIKYGILNFGSPDSNGFGLSGPATRAKLNALYANPVIDQAAINNLTPEVRTALVRDLQSRLVTLLKELVTRLQQEGSGEN